MQLQLWPSHGASLWAFGRHCLPSRKVTFSTRLSGDLRRSIEVIPIAVRRRDRAPAALLIAVSEAAIDTALEALVPGGVRAPAGGRRRRRGGAGTDDAPVEVTGWRDDTGTQVENRR